MPPQPRPKIAERFGHWLGSVWRGYRSRERQVTRCLVAKGMPASLILAGLWAIKLLVLSVLLYGAFWLGLILAFAAAAAWAGSQKSICVAEDEVPQWRMGLSGYGLYRGGVRIDPGDQDDD